MLEQISGNTGRFVFFSLFILLVILLFLSIYYLINIGNRYINTQERIKIDLKLILKLFIAIVILYLLKILFANYKILSYTLTSIIIAIIFAYVMEPVVHFLEKKGIKRPFGVIIVYISVIVIFTILLVSVVPKTLNELLNLFQQLPTVADTIITEINNFFAKISTQFNIELPKNVLDLLNTNNLPQKNAGMGQNIAATISKTINDLNTKMQTQALATIRNIVSKFYSVITSSIRILLVFIFSFYFSVDKANYNKKVQSWIPSKYREDVFYLANRIDKSLQQFIRGRLLMAFFVGFATMIYLLILGVDFAIVIGMITCVADIIPYIGPFLGFVPAVLFAFMDAPIKALWVSILFIIIQWAENNLLAPKLIGTSTGLNPLLVLVSIIIGGGVFGVWGMIISVPLTSIIFILVDFIKMKYVEKNEF